MAPISCQTVVAILGAGMIVSLALTIVTFPVYADLDWATTRERGQNMADIFATVFSVAFFAAFMLAIAEQRPGSSGPH
jgi:hypothetical protein